MNELLFVDFNEIYLLQNTLFVFELVSHKKVKVAVIHVGLLHLGGSFVSLFGLLLA